MVDLAASLTMVGNTIIRIQLVDSILKTPYRLHWCLIHWIMEFLKRAF